MIYKSYIMAIYRETKVFCHNKLCKEVTTIPIINNIYPQFPVLCPKCGFKSAYRTMCWDDFNVDAAIAEYKKRLEKSNKVNLKEILEGNWDNEHY